LSSFSTSPNDFFLDLFFTRKNATIAPTTKIEITIPAMAPPPIPDFLLPSLEPESDEGLCPPDL